MAANDVMGKLAFQAPDEGTGTDAILVAAAIQARAEGDFSSSNNATSIDFMTGASEAAATKMTLTSAGRVGIGTTAPVQKLELNENTTSGGPYLQFENRGSDGTDNSNTYNVGGILAAGYRDAANPSNISSIMFERAPYSSGASSAGSIVFGAMGNGGTGIPTERMRILPAGGLTFNGDTAAANALDDYEEGTWTPGITGSTSGSKTMAGANAGFYTKIGNNCTISGTISASGSETIAGTVYITGLPFTSHGVGNGRASGSVGTNGIFTCPADHRLAFVVDPNLTVMYAIAAKDEATITYNHTPSSGAGNVFGFSLTYKTT
jgi:hypothetical protein